MNKGYSFNDRVALISYQVYPLMIGYRALRAWQGFGLCDDWRCRPRIKHQSGLGTAAKASLIVGSIKVAEEGRGVGSPLGSIRVYLGLMESLLRLGSTWNQDPKAIHGMVFGTEIRKPDGSM